MDQGQTAEAREYRPTRAAGVHYLLGLGTTILPIWVIASRPHNIVVTVLSVLFALFGLWFLFTTYRVLHCWFVTTTEQLVQIIPGFHWGVRWEEVTAVVIRERPSIIMPGRNDRLVLVEGANERQRVTINTGVLSRSDEETILAEVNRRVQCPIRTIRDSPFPKANDVQ